MDSNDILHELLKLQQDSNANDTRIESKLEGISSRVQNIEKHSEKQDEQIDKITQILSDQKNLSKTLENIQSTTKDHEKRINTLETKAAKTALEMWKKIFAIAGTAIITAIVGFILGKLGVK